jgi:hypothetical protein
MAQQPPIKLTARGEYVFGALALVAIIVTIFSFLSIMIMLGASPA